MADKRQLTDQLKDEYKVPAKQPWKFVHRKFGEINLETLTNKQTAEELAGEFLLIKKSTSKKSNSTQK